MSGGLSAEKLRVRKGETMPGGAAAGALVILPEALAIVRQLEAKEPGPRFHLNCRAKAKSVKKHLC